MLCNLCLGDVAREMQTLSSSRADELRLQDWGSGQDAVAEKTGMALVLRGVRPLCASGLKD